MSAKAIVQLSCVAGTFVCGVFVYSAKTKTHGSKSWAVFAGESASQQVEVPNPDQDLTLKQVQLFFRHGARTPLKLIPNISEVEYDEKILLSKVPHTVYNHTVADLKGGPRPYSSLDAHYMRHKLKGGSAIGQLTMLGQDQTYLLGKTIRRRYIDDVQLIGQKFSPNDILPRSTNTQRTVDSLRCVLAGIYGNKHLNEHGNVTLYTDSVFEEVLFPNPHYCQFLKSLGHKTLTNFGNFPGVRDDRLQLEEVLGIDSSSDVSKRLNFLDCRDDIVCRTSHGFLVPEKLHQFIPTIERYATDIAIYAYSGTDGRLREQTLPLSVGRMLNLLFNTAEKAIKGLSCQKLILYSCHDTSLLVLLVALGIYDGKWPPFAADVAVELYEDKTGEHWVKVKYLGEDLTETGFGAPLVRFAQMKERLSQYTMAPSEYMQRCQVAFPKKLEAPKELNLPEGTCLPDHEETVEESAEADEKVERPAGM